MSKAKILIHTPVKLDSQSIKQISQYLGEKHSIEGEFKTVIDKSVIAGVKIVHDDLVIDLSLKGRLERLAKKIS